MEFDKYSNFIRTPIHNALYQYKIDRARKTPGKGDAWNARIPDTRHPEMPPEKAVSNISLRLLKLLHIMTEELGLRIYLAYGTLIGAVRHQGVIPWDDDIDVFMTRKDFDVLVDLARDIPKEILLLPMGPHFFKFMDSASIISKDRKRGIAVDIFILEERGKDHLSFFNVHSLKRMTYPRSAFNPHLDVPFETEVFSIPKDYHRILSDIYGDYMQLPDPEHRKASHMDYSSITIGPYGSKYVNTKKYR